MLSRALFLTSTLILLVSLPFMGTEVFAQETRGAFTGWVKDATGGVLPGAEVEAVHLGTSTKTATVANDTGNYLLPYLSPGAYRITVTMPGFKQFIRERADLRLGETLTLDVTLEVGEVSQSIVVTGQAPLIDKTSPSLSTLIDTKMLEELPIREGTVAELANLAPGVMYGTHIRLAKPGMTAGVSSLSTDGSTLRRNEYSIDGVPNVAGDNAIAYNPSSASVEEFSIGTTSYDASVGHAIGGMMNMITKSGSNEYHGLLQLVERNSAFDAWDSMTKAANNPKIVYQDHHAVGAVGGPVRIPRLYNGKDRTFFFVTVDYNKFGNPFANKSTVPTAAERTGDFSALLELGNPANYQLYDPATTRQEGTLYVRDPFPGNIIPADRINPLSRKLMEYWPLPNLNSVRYNFQARDALERHWYKTVTTRVDHAFSEKHRSYVRFTWDRWKCVSLDRFENAAAGNDQGTRNTQAGLDHVYTVTPTVVLNAKYGYQRKRRWSDRLYDWPQQEWQNAGFSDRLVNMIPDHSFYFPRMTFGDGLTEFGWGGWGGQAPLDGANDTHTLAGHLSWVKGNHNLNFGADFRVYRETYFSFRAEEPLWRFDGTYTRKQSGASNPKERFAFAAFLMGYHTNVQMGLTDNWAAQQLWSGWYLQDNWKVSPRLTLNLGLRYELENPVTERYDRMANGFDLTTPLPIEAEVRANYAQNPFPDILPEQLKVRGGWLYAGPDNREMWKRDNRNLMPRIGLAYMINDKTTLHAGYGIYYENLGLTTTVNPAQPGFSRTTTVNSSDDNGLTFPRTLADPIHEPLLRPVGKSLGLMTDVDGSNRSFGRYATKTPYSQRWSFGFHRVLPLNAVVRATYVGGRSVRLMINRNYNAVPLEYLSTSPVKDQAKINWMVEKVPNPFRGVDGVTGTLSTQTTIERYRLLRPFPQYGNLTFSDPSGYSTYHALQMDFDRRFADGFSIGGAYTFSKSMEATSFLTAADPVPYYQISANDRTHIFNARSILHLPFGRGRKFGSDWNGAVNHLLGGWQIGTLLRVQGGGPVGFGQFVLKPGKNLTDILLPDGERDIAHYFKNDNYYLKVNGGDKAAAAAQKIAEFPFELDTSINGLDWNRRTIPERFSWIRGPGFILLDANLKKEIRFGESKSLSIRLDASNVLNQVNYLGLNADPNRTGPTGFGAITSLNGYPRQIQLWLTFKF